MLSVAIDWTIRLLSPQVWKRSIVMCTSVCLFVCPWAYLRNAKSKHQWNFCACWLWPWLGPSLTALQYMCFRFCGWRHDFMNIMDPMTTCRYRRSPATISYTAIRANTAAACVVLVALYPRWWKAPRLDESFVQEVSGRRMRCTSALFLLDISPSRPLLAQHVHHSMPHLCYGHDVCLSVCNVQTVMWSHTARKSENRHIAG